MFAGASDTTFAILIILDMNNNIKFMLLFDVFVYT